MNSLENGIHRLKNNNIDIKIAYYLFKYLDNASDFDSAIEKVIKGIPVQYIVGNVDFFGINFKVNSNVLIPRFETEELVDKTLKYVSSFFSDKIDIVDLGTGSGCIAITLKKKLDSFVSAVDISSDALEVAKENASLNDVDVDFYLGDFLNPLNKKYDLIISNPPYISYDEEIMDIVSKNEPSLALYADNNGLYFYESILKEVRNYVKDRFMIAFEIGSKQGSTIKDLCHKYLDDVRVIIEKDLQDRDRFIFVFKD